MWSLYPDCRKRKDKRGKYHGSEPGGRLLYTTAATGFALCRRVIKSLQTLCAIFKLSWRCENFQKELSFSCLQKGRQRGKKDRQDDFKHCHK
jgi:hypothetical protein